MKYVVLHGKSGRWDELVDSCKFYEQQMRMVDAASMRQVEQQILSYCGKKGHAKKDWKRQQERSGKGDSKGKYKSDGKGKDGGKHSAGKGNEKGKQAEREWKGQRGKDDGKESQGSVLEIGNRRLLLSNLVEPRDLWLVDSAATCRLQPRMRVRFVSCGTMG